MNGRYVAVGDSFTEGVGDANLMYPNGVRGWADRMARQMGRADATWEYANFAIRSKRLDEIVDEQFDAALALEPTLISFYAGGNDILAVRCDMPAIMERYEAALQRLVGSGAQVLLFTTFDVKISTCTWKKVYRTLRVTRWGRFEVNTSFVCPGVFHLIVC